MHTIPQRGEFMKNLILSIAMLFMIDPNSIVSFISESMIKECVNDSISIQKNISEGEKLPIVSGLSQQMCGLLTCDNMEDIKVDVVDINGWKSGWINSQCVNIRKEPSTKSKVLGTLGLNETIKYHTVNNDWCCIFFNNDNAYVHSDFISNKEVKHTDYSMPVTNGFKSFMTYRAITAIQSPQYQLQSMSYTGKYGIRQVNDRYCVALGTAFNIKIGTYFDMILNNGEVIPCILGDIKADRDTDMQNITTLNNGCASEFIVDIGSLNSNAKINGDISQCCEEWDSSISIIRVYEKNVFQ